MNSFPDSQKLTHLEKKLPPLPENLTVRAMARMERSNRKPTVAMRTIRCIRRVDDRSNGSLTRAILRGWLTPRPSGALFLRRDEEMRTLISGRVGLHISAIWTCAKRTRSGSPHWPQPIKKRLVGWQPKLTLMAAFEAMALVVGVVTSIMFPLMDHVLNRQDWRAVSCTP